MSRFKLPEGWVRSAGVFGTLFLFAALLFFLYDNHLSNRVFGLIAAGGICFGIWISFAPDDLRGWVSGRQAATGTTSFILTAIFAAFVVMVYDASDQQNITLDFTCNEQFTLNQPSLDTLSRLQRTGQLVRLVGFYPRSALREREAADVILRQFDGEGGEAVELRYIDPDEDPLTARQYAYPDYVAVREDNRRDALYISFVDSAGNIDVDSLRPIDPINERTISNAIVDMLTVGGKMFYFTTGHTELDIESQAGTGLARAVGGLRALNIESATLNLLTEDIPSDAAVLVIAGNSTPFVEEEVDKIRAFVAQGGRLLIMTNPPYVDATFGGVSTPLLPDSPLGVYLWEEFGFRPQSTLIVDNASSFDTPYNPVPAGINDTHPILTGFNDNTAIVFSLVSSVEWQVNPTGAAANYNIAPLFGTSDDSYGETSLQVLEAGTLTEYTEGEDIDGPLVMAVAVSPKAEINQETGTRVVYIGDVDWITNDFIVNFPSHASLWAGMAEWLTGSPEIITIDPVIGCNAFPIYTTAQERQRISIITTLVLPMLVLALGGTVLYLRRRS